MADLISGARVRISKVFDPTLSLLVGKEGVVNDTSHHGMLAGVFVDSGVEAYGTFWFMKEELEVL